MRRQCKRRCHSSSSLSTGIGLLFAGSSALGIKGIYAFVGPYYTPEFGRHGCDLDRHVSLTCQNDGNNNENNYHKGDVLNAEDSMFKIPSSDLERCTWPILTVDPQAFSLVDAKDISLPAQISPRSFEYGSSWVEHYYRPLIIECRKHNRFGIVHALYQWYTAQFTLDYLHEEVSITADQFQYASFLSHDESCMNDGNLDKQTKTILEGCRSLMANYTNAMKTVLPADVHAKIQEGTDSFFKSSVEQITGDRGEENMSFEEYMHFRAINAGGMFGFIEQCHFLQWIHPKEEPLVSNILSDLAKNVGMHIALLNDLYGLERDAKTGDLNIVIKYADTTKCTKEEAIEWAVGRLQRCAVNVYAICEKYPGTIPSKFNVAMDCISGNHGFHDASKRYKLPDGFIWPDSCLIEYKLLLETEPPGHAIF